MNQAHRCAINMSLSRSADAVKMLTWPVHPLQVVKVEQDHCGQFSYPTIQHVPDTGMVFVAYTVLFLPASMPPDCRVRRLPRAQARVWVRIRVRVPKHTPSIHSAACSSLAQPLHLPGVQMLRLRAGSPHSGVVMQAERAPLEE